MRTETRAYHKYFVTKYDSEVLASSIFTPRPEPTNPGDKCGHDEGDLFLVFKSGKTYYYPQVKSSWWIGLVLAESAGRYFNANIRNLPCHDVTGEDVSGTASALADLVMA